MSSISKLAAPEIVIKEIHKNNVINKLKTLQNINDFRQDEVLDILYDMVLDEIKEVVGDIVIGEKFQSLVLKMLNHKYSRQGTEILTSYNYSGVSETFVEGYPEDIKLSLKRLKKQKVRFI